VLTDIIPFLKPLQNKPLPLIGGVLLEHLASEDRA
jgi:hypothetical protein